MQTRDKPSELVKDALASLLRRSEERDAAQARTDALVEKLRQPATRATTVTKADAEQELARWSEELALQQGVSEPQAFYRILQTKRGKLLAKTVRESDGPSSGALNFGPTPEPVAKLAPSRAFDQLETMAKNIAEKDGITREQGFAKAIETDEGKELYGQYRREKEAAART